MKYIGNSKSSKHMECTSAYIQGDKKVRKNDRLFSFNFSVSVRKPGEDFWVSLIGFLCISFIVFFMGVLLSANSEVKDFKIKTSKGDVYHISYTEECYVWGCKAIVNPKQEVLIDGENFGVLNRNWSPTRKKPLERVIQTKLKLQLMKNSQ